MKGQYIKGNIRYLIIDFLLFLTNFVVFISVSFTDFTQKATLVCDSFYILVFISCAIQTLKNRRQIDEIINKGRCKKGIVNKVIKVSYRSSIGRFGNDLESSAYQIEAEVIDEFGCSFFYNSELLPKRAIKTLSKEVKVYRYGDRICMLWDKPIQKEKFKIERNNIVIDTPLCRKILIFANGILGMEIIALVIACFV